MKRGRSVSRCQGAFQHIALDKAQRINGEITAPEVRLIGGRRRAARYRDRRGRACGWRKKRTSIWWRSRRPPKPPVCRSWTTASSSTRAEEGARGEAQAEADPGQGSEVSARHGRGRLPDQAAQPDPLPRGRRQGQGHVAFPRPRNGAPGNRRAPAGAGADGSGAVRRWSSSSRRWKAGRWSWCWRRRRSTAAGMRKRSSSRTSQGAGDAAGAAKPSLQRGNK